MSFLLFPSVPSLSSYHKSTSLYQYSLIILSQSAQEAKHFVFLRKIFVLVTKTRKILCVFSLFFHVSFRARDVEERPVDVRFATTGAKRRLQNIRWTFALQRPERSGDCRTSGGRSLCNDRWTFALQRPVDVRFATTGAKRRPRTFESRRGSKTQKRWYPIGYHLFVFLLERETGLEPAASTLARSRSTN